MSNQPTTFRAWFAEPVLREVRRVGKLIMASVAAELTAVAAELNDNLFPAISNLLAENATLRTENASLKDEDVAESQASSAVVAGTQKISGLFATNPDIPDVPPVDEPPADSDV